VDLVVATPGRLAEHLAAGTLTLERCGAVVLDETDVLLGDAGAFREQARRARRRRPCPRLPSEPRMGGVPRLCSACWAAPSTLSARVLRIGWHGM
jgi:hypothetical protein